MQYLIAICLVNVIVILNRDNLCSIGVHPWDAEQISVEKIKPLFEQLKLSCNVVAIGRMWLR